MMKLTILLLLTVLTTNLSQGQSRQRYCTDTLNQTFIVKNNTHGVALNECTFEKFKKYILKPDSSDTCIFHIANESEIAKLESNISKHHRKKLKKYVHNDLHNYTRQYIFYKHNGELMAWVNFLYEEHKEDNDSWKSKIISVFDGGINYFRIKYNFTTKKFTDFGANGLA